VRITKAALKHHATVKIYRQDLEILSTGLHSCSFACFR